MLLQSSLLPLISCQAEPLQYAISFDNESPQIITLVPEDYNARNGNTDWEKTVSDNARLSHSLHTINTPGYHTLKIFMVDQGVVLQKIIVNSGGLKPSYLGPPESYFKNCQSSIIILTNLISIEMKKETKSISRRKFIDTSVKATFLSSVAIQWISYDCSFECIREKCSK